MSRQTQGLRKEHELAKEIYDVSGGRVFALRAGWSGNSAIPSPDLLIPLGGILRAVELKTSNQKRLTVEPEDVEDILEWVDQQKEVPTIAYLAIKFSRWEVYVAPLPGGVESIERAFKLWAAAAPFDTNVTKSGNLTIGHPSHYDVEHTSSIKSEGDGIAMIRQLSRDEHSKLVSVTDVLRESDNYWPS